MGQWRRSGVVIDSSAAPKMIQTFARPSRLYTSAGAAKTMIHLGTNGANDDAAISGQTTPALGDYFEFDLYCQGGESFMNISTTSNTDHGAYDIFVNGVQLRNYLPISDEGNYYTDDGGVWADDTTDAGDAGAADFAFFPAVEAINDACYFGWPVPFCGMALSLSTPAIGGSIEWEYWNGAAWVAIPGIVDGTAGLLNSGEQKITFPRPSDWATKDPDGVGGLTVTQYYIRLRVTAANLTQTPVGSYCYIDAGYDDYAAVGAQNHRYLYISTALGFDMNPGYNLIKLAVNAKHLTSTDYRMGIGGLNVQ